MWHIKLKLQDILDERGMSYEDLAKLTRMRASTIHDIAIEFKKIKLGQLAVIMKVLEIEKMSDILQIYKGKEKEED